MDVAELRAVYSATSADFDRVTDHVQKRLKETQAQASGLGGASQTVANEAKRIESTLTSRAPVRFLGIDLASEKKAAAEVVSTAQNTVKQVEQATSKFDRTAFWARQGTQATNAAKTVEKAWSLADTEQARAASRLAAAEEQVLARRVTNAAKATSTVIRDAKTGATLTQAELAKIISGGSKVVEAEAKKVGAATGGVFANLQKLFLQNNFLFRQLGQRVAGDLGFTAVGVGKLALNFEQLAGKSLVAAAGMEGAAGGAASLLGILGPVGIAVGVVVAGLTAMAALSISAAVGMFYLAKSVTDTEEHLDDLSRQTGLSTDNLQVLEITTRQAGSNIDKFIGSVGQLQRKLVDASEGGTSRLSIGLKKLGVDLDNPNIALGQLIDLLSKVERGNARTGAAMQIFGRGGREVAGVVDQIEESVGNADGALDRLKKQFIDAGVHIDKDGIKTAGKFHDQLILIEAQFESVKRVIGEEALPTVLDAATKFSNWIATNRTEIADWAKAIEHVAETLTNLGAILLKLTGLSLLIPVTIQLRIARSFKSPSGDTTSDIAELIGKTIGEKAPLPDSTLARRTFTQDRQAQDVAENAANKIRSAFAPKGRGGHKGEDPAETARRLAEISLQETLKGLQAEHDALERQLDQNLVSRNRYTQDAINLELRRRQETIAGLRKELDEAEKIRKPGQRAIKVAEINARIKEEERRSAKEVQQITDESAAEQLRIGQATAQSQLRIIETQTDQVKARIREQADFRIVTEQQAAEFEENQALRVFNAREQLIRQELREAGDNAEKRNEARNKLDELNAERKSFIESSSRAIAAAIRSDAEHVIQFAAQIRDAFQRAADVRLEAGEANLEPLRNSILTRHQLWDAELKFEIEREKRRHDQVMSGLDDEARLAQIRIKNEQELAAVLSGIRAQSEAEEELHQARLGQITTQAAEQRRQEMLQVADDLASIASDIFDAIGKSSDEFWKSLKQSATNFAKQIRDELFKGFLEKLITGQAQGAEGLIGAIVNPLLRAREPNAAVSDNTKATQSNTAAIHALTRSMGGTAPLDIESGLSSALHEVGHGIGQVSDVLGGLFGGGRATGGPVNAGRIYQVHDNEFFRPNVSGRIYNLDQMSAVVGKSNGEVRTIVALGDDAVSDAMESHRLTPQGRRAQIVRGRWNRKTGGLQFA
ncbi:MAG TPA: hypothetical protein VL866_24005 [Pyrinomonadaceae bacterium]|nr:hypothetical protein [Pyrinomonadaceae bacterium]